MQITNTEWREVQCGQVTRWAKSFPGSLFDHDMVILRDADGTFSVHEDIDCVGIVPHSKLKGFATLKVAQDATDQSMCKPGTTT